MILASSASGQSPCGDDLCVVQFNAGFNEANKVTWVGELSDCSTKFIKSYEYYKKVNEVLNDKLQNMLSI